MLRYPARRERRTIIGRAFSFGVRWLPLNNLGILIRTIRTARALTQEALGAALVPPVTQERINAIECGRRRPGPEVLARIASALGVPSELFLNGLESRRGRYRTSD